MKTFKVERKDQRSLKHCLCGHETSFVLLSVVIMSSEHVRKSHLAITSFQFCPRSYLIVDSEKRRLLCARDVTETSQSSKVRIRHAKFRSDEQRGRM